MTTCEYFDFDSAAWTEEKLTFEADHVISSAAVAVGSDLFVIGGCSGPFHNRNCTRSTEMYQLRHGVDYIVLHTRSWD